jgi:hypothetical protein
VRQRALVAAELALVVVWAVLFTRPYLDFDPFVIPVGREYGQSILTHHLWTRIGECGWCALWFGNARGGSPAFADALFGSMLHPLVIVTSLGWGVLNGSKLALAGAFVLAGLAQWWLAYVLGLGRLARLWSAGLAVIGGHLASRMELGSFGLVLSAAACALVLPPLVLVARTGSRRAAVLLGGALALAALSGQGYLQVGLVLALPAALLLLPWDRARLALLARRLALAAVLALLLAAPFLVPFAHFLPQFIKETDGTFGAAQPFAYIPFNLLIADYGFYLDKALGKLPWPSHYALYIGWLPVVLALWGVRCARSADERRAVAFLAAMAVLAFWVASGAPLRWLVQQTWVPGFAGLVAGVRYPAFIASLAVPPLLALAAIGLDQCARAAWPKLRLGVSINQGSPLRLVLDSRWLLGLALVLALVDVWAFNQRWIGTYRLAPEVPGALAALRTPDLQWVSVPMGEHFFTEPAVARGLKLADDYRTWFWNGHPLPEPARGAWRLELPPGVAPVSTRDGVTIGTAGPGREYAVVTDGSGGRAICAAHGSGGQIDVTCDAPRGGTLLVRENAWDGWDATLDGAAAARNEGLWLSVAVPPGSHVIGFRYRPWDVPLGLALCLAGLALAVVAWRRADPPLAAEAHTGV